MILRVAAFSLIALCLTFSAAAQTDPVRIDSRPMRDGTGIVVGHLITATNTSNEVQCVLARAEPALVSGGGIFKPRLVLKPRERGVAFARYMGGRFFEGVALYLEPDPNCPERTSAR